MTNYTNTNPVFSSSIPVVEITDAAHADNINASAKQLLQNDLVLAQMLDVTLVDAAFYSTFSHLYGDGDGSLTPTDILDALNTEWRGESSDDPMALNAEQIEDALNTEWRGETSDDPGALTADEIAETISRN